MLVEFTVGNYRSFKDPVHLSLVAANLKAKDKGLDERNTFQVDKDLTLLKSAAIYGANASGKSNLVAAMLFMSAFVLNSSRETQITDAIPTQPFALHPETPDQPSLFEMVFVLDGRLYRYGFEVNTARVVAEWLYYVPKTKEARLFERQGDDFKLSEAFKEGKEIVPLTRSNALFLSVVAQFNGPIARSILNWFQSLSILSGIDDHHARFVTEQTLGKPELRNDVIQIIKLLDLGIDDIELAEFPLSSAVRRARQLPDSQFHLDPVAKHELPPEVDDEMDELLRNMAPLLERVVQSLENAPTLVIRARHKVYNENGEVVGTELFDVDQRESQGTRKLIALAGPLLLTLRSGAPLVVDELDARLHPLITCAILKLFNSPQTNPRNAQLIFTTQDTNLLNRDLLRRDQIWFVEKDRQAASQLYSLAEFRAERRVRNDASFEADYIRGKYGAVPFLGDLQWVLGEPHE